MSNHTDFQINEKSLVGRKINFLPPSHFAIMRKLPKSKITRGTSTQLKKYEKVSISWNIDWVGILHEMFRESHSRWKWLLKIMSNHTEPKLMRKCSPPDFSNCVEVIWCDHDIDIDTPQVTFSHCWELSVIFLILLEVKSGWKVTFRMLLRIGGKSRFSYCWKLRQGVENHFSHVGHQVESPLFS